MTPTGDRVGELTVFNIGGNKARLIAAIHYSNHRLYIRRILTHAEYDTDTNQEVGLALFCPITARSKGYPYEVAIPQGLPIEGAILSDQLKSLDWRARKARVAARLPEAPMAEVLSKTRTLTA